ncbi:MAG: hypothetical protein JW703_01055 [Candidatus Diapherotrites archaeon]|nr:hypothetical protein [Candidatus Diapherotrites archaeon]
MSFIYDLGKKVTGAIPVLVRRTGSVLLFFAMLGSILGFLIGINGLNPLWLAGLPLAMVVMWNDLDQGVLVLVLYLILFWSFPSFL